MSKAPIWIGYILFGIYLLQLLFPISIEWIDELQNIESYKRWSGLFLFSFILFQWLLTLTRLRRKEANTTDKMLALHKWLGALSPLIFMIHSVNFGFGFLVILSVTFFFNFILGLLNTEIIKKLGNGVFRIWYISHIVGSVVISCLSILHIWIVFYYK